MLFHFGLTECSASPSKAAPTVATKEAFYVLRWDRGLGSVQPESTQTQAALGSAEASRKRRVSVGESNFAGVRGSGSDRRGLSLGTCCRVKPGQTSRRHWALKAYGPTLPFLVF